MENEKATILWDHQVKTDRHITCNKPDIIIQEKDSDRCLIIDVAIPSDYNIQKKATEKVSKYVHLQIECQRMWNNKVEVIPITIGATGIVEKGIQSYFQKKPGKHNLYNLQRSAILGRYYQSNQIKVTAQKQPTMRVLGVGITPDETWQQHHLTRSELLRQ